MGAGSPDLTTRFDELAKVPGFAVSSTGTYVRGGAVGEVQQWMVEVTNLVSIATGRRGTHWEQAQAALLRANSESPLKVETIHVMRGVLAATRTDRERGLLSQIEYSIFAEAFDDFLDNAASLHKSGQLEGSAVLVSAVLEDTVKKIARKNQLAPAPTLEPAINDLVSAGVFTPVMAKRVKAWAAVRTAAFHARWNEIDLKAVGEAIAGTRELISDYLD